ncbi:zinc finger protein 277-like isoform X2 [Apostichopus japonicus]
MEEAMSAADIGNPGPSPVEALIFPEVTDDDLDEGNKQVEYICPLCKERKIYVTSKELFCHMRIEHKLLIADSHLICDLERYLNYWHDRFQEEPIHALGLPTSEEDNKTYYVLCDQLQEDSELRQKLQVERLNIILRTQQKERQDVSFSSPCLFCQELYTGNRSDLFNHMARDHNFNVGLPDNLVFTKEFLRVLREKMDSLQCLYCEKIFRDKIAIREHMRKKQHRKLNPKNKTFDKYYIINYLEMGKGWQAVQAERDEAPQEAGQEDWDDWQETAGATAVCLFCNQHAVETTDLLEHMKQKHEFDLDRIKTTLKLNFYKQLKVVNFIRHRIHQKMCFSCHQVYATQDALVGHMTDSKHIQDIPDNTEWDQPEYYIPTYENDTLLFGLPDDEDEVTVSQTPVIAEETKVDIQNSILRDVHIRSSLSVT